MAGYWIGWHRCLRHTLCCTLEMLSVQCQWLTDCTELKVDLSYSTSHEASSYSFQMRNMSFFLNLKSPNLSKKKHPNNGFLKENWDHCYLNKKTHTIKYFLQSLIVLDFKGTYAVNLLWKTHTVTEWKPLGLTKRMGDLICKRCWKGATMTPK